MISIVGYEGMDKYILVYNLSKHGLELWQPPPAYSLSPLHHPSSSLVLFSLVCQLSLRT